MRSEDVVQERFRTTRFEPGYDQREVDAFLESAAHALRSFEADGGRIDGGEPPIDQTAIGSDAIASVRFTPTRYREGYHPADVDAFLDRLASAFERLERAAAARR